MASQETFPTPEQIREAHEQDFPLLLAKRYNPEAEDAQESVHDENTESVVASTPTAHFSFSRIARGVVDSLVPEPLRPQRVLRKRPPPLDLSLARKFNASTVALSERHQVRPCSSVYDQKHPWPTSTVYSQSATILEADDLSRSDSSQQRWPGLNYDRTWVSDPLAQASSKNSGDEGQGMTPGSSSTVPYARMPEREFQFWLSNETPPATGENRRSSIEANNKVVVDSEQQAVEREQQLVAQVTALRLPALSRRRQQQQQQQQQRQQPPGGVTFSSTASQSDTEPLLCSAEPYVPFDSVDPYHHSGLPKKKTLYGPKGYLGKKKDWKKTPLQKMVSRVNSVGTRVKNTIRRSLSSNKDQRAELVYGIVMKPNIAINVARQTQAEIFCKLELFMCVAANEYLLAQLHHDRFVGPDSIRRFVNMWKAKNRAVVPEFQFNLRTQYEIVIHNVRNFEFRGKYGLDPILLKSTLDAWDSVVNQLNVRNFCWPDSAILKLFHDVHPILEMLGAPAEFMAVFLEMHRLVIQIVEESKKIHKIDKATFDPETESSPPSMPRRGYHSG